MRNTSDQKRAGILAILGILCLASALLLAEDTNFSGTWKGELGQTPPAAPGAGPGAASKTGGGGGGRGNPAGGFGGGGFGGPQKITLRVASVNKDKGTAKGNFTMGTSNTEDIHEAKVMGNKMTFKTGLPPAQIYEYEAVLNGEELSVSRAPAAGGRGGIAQKFTLTKNK